MASAASARGREDRINGRDQHYLFPAIDELHAGADPDEDAEEDDAAVSSR